MSTSSQITEMLVRWGQGDQQAFESLLPLVYGELRGIAARQLRGERREHTLAPTALVHELYLRLVNQRHASWQNRAQFFGIAAQLMRRILVDYARARRTEKRGGATTFVQLEDAAHAGNRRNIADVLAVDEALEKLTRLDPEQARVMELRFFAGLTVEEVAHVLSRSPRTVKREWRLARAWLYRELRNVETQP